MKGSKKFYFFLPILVQSFFFFYKCQQQHSIIVFGFFALPFFILSAITTYLKTTTPATIEIMTRTMAHTRTTATLWKAFSKWALGPRIRVVWSQVSSWSKIWEKLGLSWQSSSSWKIWGGFGGGGRSKKGGGGGWKQLPSPPSHSNQGSSSMIDWKGEEKKIL